MRSEHVKIPIAIIKTSTTKYILDPFQLEYAWILKTDLQQIISTQDTLLDYILGSLCVCLTFSTINCTVSTLDGDIHSIVLPDNATIYALKAFLHNHIGLARHTIRLVLTKWENQIHPELQTITIGLDESNVLDHSEPVDLSECRPIRENDEFLCIINTKNCLHENQEIAVLDIWTGRQNECAQWRSAIIHSIQDGMIRVHFEGWANSDDITFDLKHREQWRNRITLEKYLNTEQSFIKKFSQTIKYDELQRGSKIYYNDNIKSIYLSEEQMII